MFTCAILCVALVGDISAAQEAYVQSLPPHEARLDDGTVIDIVHVDPSVQSLEVTVRKMHQVIYGNRFTTLKDLPVSFRFFVVRHKGDTWFLHEKEWARFKDKAAVAGLPTWVIQKYELDAWYVWLAMICFASVSGLLVGSVSATNHQRQVMVMMFSIVIVLYTLLFLAEGHSLLLVVAIVACGFAGYSYGRRLMLPKYWFQGKKQQSVAA